MTYTDEQVKEAARTFDHYSYDENENFGVLVWAANEYLKAKEVIEYYAEFDKDDGGRVARDFLKQTNGGE